jgi:peptide chain release factor 2
LQEAQSLIAQLNRELEQWEIQQLLSDPYDQEGAFLIIEAKPEDIASQVWATAIVKMYVHWAESHNFQIHLFDIMGEDSMSCEAESIESLTLEIWGRYAYGYLKAERGKHHLRGNLLFPELKKQNVTSVKVEVIPLLDKNTEVDIPGEDLEITVRVPPKDQGRSIRREGVQIVHIPTGLTVSSDEQRGIPRNKEKALCFLRSKLFAIAQAQGVKEISKIQRDLIKHETSSSSVREYLYLCIELNGYRCIEGKVVDYRTGMETTAITGVMKGELDPFIHAYLRINQDDASL